MLFTVTFTNRRSGSSAADSSNRNLALSRLAREKLCHFVLQSRAAPSHCYQRGGTNTESVRGEGSQRVHRQTSRQRMLIEAGNIWDSVDVELFTGRSDGLSVYHDASSQC